MRQLLSRTAVLCSLLGLTACVVAPAPPPAVAYAPPAPAYAAPGYAYAAPPAVYAAPVIAVGPRCWRCSWHRWWW